MLTHIMIYLYIIPGYYGWCGWKVTPLCSVPYGITDRSCLSEGNSQTGEDRQTEGRQFLVFQLKCSEIVD